MAARSIGDATLARLPDQLARYRVTVRLGEGGIGVVYEAVDGRVGRPSALKVIRRESIADGLPVVEHQADDADP